MLNDVFPCGYVRGNCTRGFIPAKTTEGAARPAEHDPRNDDGSLICLMVPRGSALLLPVDMFDLTGVTVLTSSETQDVPTFQRVTHEQGPYLFSRLDGAANIRNRPVYYDMHTGSSSAQWVETDWDASGRRRNAGMKLYTAETDLVNGPSPWAYNTVCFLGQHTGLEEHALDGGVDNRSIRPTADGRGCGHWKSHSTQGSAAARSGLPNTMDEADPFDDPMRAAVQRRGRAATGKWLPTGGRTSAPPDKHAELNSMNVSGV